MLNLVNDGVFHNAEKFIDKLFYRHNVGITQAALDVETMN